MRPLISHTYNQLQDDMVHLIKRIKKEAIRTFILSFHGDISLKYICSAFYSWGHGRRNRMVVDETSAFYIYTCLSSFDIAASGYLIGLVKGEFEDTKMVIKIHKSKDRQRNGQKKNDKRKPSTCSQSLTHFIT
jgi:hypothetical protein